MTTGVPHRPPHRARPAARARPTVRVLTALVVLVGAATAWAQAPVYVPTGTLSAHLDGERVVFRTHANLVPEPGQRVDDADARALVEALTGREVNTATFIVTDPLVAGGVAALPGTLTVSLSAMVAPDDRSERRQLVVGIGLDPATLAWDGDPRRIAVAFHPERWSATAHYELSELHEFELTLVEAVAPHVLRVAGRLRATLTWRAMSNFRVVHDPSRTVDLVLDFEAYPVVGDDVLVPLLEDAAGGG